MSVAGCDIPATLVSNFVGTIETRAIGCKDAAIFRASSNRPFTVGGREMCRFVVSVVAAAALSICVAQAASAAGLPVKAPAYQAPIWTGFYIGINGGGAFGTTRVTHTGLTTTAGTPAGSFNLDHRSNGWLAGATFGYNWQMASWVIGGELDFDGADIHGTGRLDGTAVTLRDGSGGIAGNFVTASEKITAFGTARLRAGMLVMPSTLLFATGGLAVGHVNYSGQMHFAAVPIDYIGSDSATHAGWTLGSGLEHRYNGNLSVKAEYLYYDLGKHTLVTTQNGIAGFSSQFDT
jgi:outer membrane immunogenic protein